MTTLKLAGCIIRDEAGRVLLLHRNTEKRKQWEIPGGKIDPGEDTKVTAIREVEEELGIDVEITEILGDKEFTEDDFTMHYTWFAAKIISGKPKINEPHTFDGLRYFSKQDMEAHMSELSPNTQNFLAVVEKN